MDGRYRRPYLCIYAIILNRRTTPGDGDDHSNRDIHGYIDTVDHLDHNNHQRFLDNGISFNYYCAHDYFYPDHHDNSLSSNCVLDLNIDADANNESILKDRLYHHYHHFVSDTDSIQGSYLYHPSYKGYSSSRCKHNQHGSPTVEPDERPRMEWATWQWARWVKRLGRSQAGHVPQRC
jgi:hypothetical protein